jgi:hypothetical protein
LLLGAARTFDCFCFAKVEGSNLYDRRQEKIRPNGRIFSWWTDSNGDRTLEGLDELYQILLNYDKLKHGIEKTNLRLQSLVKPESLSATIFLM